MENNTKQEIIINVVHFRGNEDDVLAIYTDGDIHKYGDGYHHKMNVFIKGFIEGLQFTGIPHNVVHIKITDPDLLNSVANNGNPPPLEFSELKNKY